MSKEAMKLALEALRPISHNSTDDPRGQADKAIKALEEALAKQEQGEPVAWQYRDANDDGTWTAWMGCDKRLTESDCREVRPLYTTPPQRTWVGLTDREKSNLWLESRAAIPRFHTYATLVEAKLKKKNT